MAVPFRRTSKTKKRMRRTHLKKDTPTISKCPKCGEPIKPHRVCTKCGYYKNEDVLKLEKEENKEVVEKKEVKKTSKKDTKKSEE